MVEETTAVRDRWKQLGIMLGMKYDVLAEIRTDYHGSQCQMSEMLNAWLEKGSATWSSLVLAVSKIGNKALGMEIAAAHGKYHLTIYSVTGPHFTLTRIISAGLQCICQKCMELRTDELVIA